MKAAFFINLLLAGTALAADLPIPFHHVRLASLELKTSAQTVPLKAISKGWLSGIPFSATEGPTAVAVGASRRLNKYLDYSWTSTRYGFNDRAPYQMANPQQHWTSAVKFEFHF